MNEGGEKDLHQSTEAAIDDAGLNEVQKYIDNLDDKESRSEFSEVLTSSVIDALANISDEAKARLSNSFKKAYEKNKDDPDFQKLIQSLSKLRGIFGINLDNKAAAEQTPADATEQKQDQTPPDATEQKQDQTPPDATEQKQDQTPPDATEQKQDQTPPENVDAASDVDWPKSTLVGSLGEIADGNESRLTSKLIRNAPDVKDGEQDQTPSELRFYESFNEVKNQFDKVESLLADENLKDNEDLKGMKDLLVKIQKVMNNTTKSNVNELQKFIYNNLDDGEFKTKYKTLNHMRSNGIDFDGDFGVSTLAGLKIVLDNKIKPFVTSMEGKLAEVKQQQTEKQDNPEDTDETEEADQVAAEAAPEKPALNTTPLTFNGGQHLVMENSNDIASNAKLDGAVFYSGTLQNPQVEVGEDGKWQTREVPTDGKDYICLMQLKNHPGELYEVKVDKAGNVCPIAKQIDLNLSTKNGDYLSTEVLISNNDSCRDYLVNKLPSAITDTTDIKIRWNNSVKDYTLWSYNKELTIEPMTMAGDWVSDKTKPDHLSKSLAFLNLTNYIRSVGDKYGNKDPNIKFDDDGLWIRGLRTPTVPKGKMHVNGFPEAYGLTGVTSEEKNAFKGYNNHERWRDDWDRKKANKIYKKI